jgi:hypothetical protein
LCNTTIKQKDDDKHDRFVVVYNPKKTTTNQCSLSFFLNAQKQKQKQQAPIHYHLLELMNKISRDDDESGAPCSFLQVLKKTN